MPPRPSSRSTRKRVPKLCDKAARRSVGKLPTPAVVGMGHNAPRSRNRQARAAGTVSPAKIPKLLYCSLPSPRFEVVAPFEPAGDQPKAIAELVEGLNRGDRYQTL